MKVLVYGYGNPGRLDDGLGPALATEVASWELPDVSVETNFQLQIEDAALVAEYDVVIFADADVRCPAPFALRPLPAADEVRFTTHSVAPGSILALAQDHFGAAPRGYTLGIRGNDFDDFGEHLSESAQANLRAAAEYLRHNLRQGRFFSSLSAKAPPEGSSRSKL